MYNKGFTKFEIILGLAVIGIAVLVSLPPLQGGVQEDQATRARLKAETVAWAVLDYREDNGKWPEIGAEGVDLACLTLDNASAREIPAAAMMGAQGLPIEADGSSSEQGEMLPDKPILEEVPLDFWNRPFTVQILDLPPAEGALAGAQAIVVLSAGPDGVLETDPSAWPLACLAQVAPREMTDAQAAAAVDANAKEPVRLLVGDDMACILTREMTGGER